MTNGQQCSTLVHLLHERAICQPQKKAFIFLRTYAKIAKKLNLWNRQDAKDTKNKIGNLVAVRE